MRLLNLTLIATALAAAALASNAAFAGGGHGHAHVGVVIGAPLWGPWYYPAPYYYPPYYYPPAYYPPAAAVSPPAYIEKEDEAPASSAYWYYCPDAKGYYPYVKECPAGWQRVAPQPPSGK